jgi:hypothetical protein
MKTKDLAATMQDLDGLRHQHDRYGARWGVAVHEIGHAFLALVHDIPFRHVTLLDQPADDGLHGYVLFDGDGLDLSASVSADDALDVHAAGIGFELVLAPGDSVRQCLARAWGDYQNAAHVIGVEPHRVQTNQQFVDAMNFAVSIAQQNRTAATAMAVELLLSGKLTRDEVFDVYAYWNGVAKAAA